MRKQAIVVESSRRTGSNEIVQITSLEWSALKFVQSQSCGKETPPREPADRCSHHDKLHLNHSPSKFLLLWN